MENITTVTVRCPYDFTNEPKKVVGGLTSSVDSFMRISGGNWVCSALDGKGEQKDISEPYNLYTTDVEHELYDSPYDDYINNQVHATMNDIFDVCSIPTTDDEGWNQYLDVSNKLAERAVEVSNGRYLLNGYHLFTATKKIRELDKQADINLFIHTVIPPANNFRKMEKSNYILECVSMCDRIFVHTEKFKSNLKDIFEQENVEYNGKIIVQPAPVDTERLERNYSIEERDKTLIFSTDRMDFHKGIPLKLRSYELFLRRNEDLHGTVQLKQKLSIGRAHSLSKHKQQYDDVKQISSRINERYGNQNWNPVKLTTERLTEQEMMNAYVNADCLLVTPLSDGLNLTVFEYLICNKFAGSDSYPIVTENAGCVDVLDNISGVKTDSYHISSAIEDFVRNNSSYELNENNIPRPTELLQQLEN